MGVLAQYGVDRAQHLVPQRATMDRLCPLRTVRA
jgi:hypothetical protein